MVIKINEIFSSIQGEANWSGLPCSFVRLTGCNLQCTYCDTPYAREAGREWSIASILTRLNNLKWKRICITGGEPLHQRNTPALITTLLDHHYEVCLETNGSLDISSVDHRCVKIMDIKCPSSQMHSHYRFENIHHLGRLDQVKFVIADRDDFRFACEMTQTIAQAVSADRILYSPVYGRLEADRLARWILDSHTDVRFQIQLHRYLWPHRDRGV